MSLKIIGRAGSVGRGRQLAREHGYDFAYCIPSNEAPLRFVVMVEDHQPIADHKTVCQAMAPAGWTYGGFDEGFYLFQTGSYATGFRLMEVIEEDLTPQCLARMAELGVTRDRVATRARKH